MKVNFLVMIFAIMFCQGLTPAHCYSAIIRPFPYPFGHVISVANDIDLQPAWYGNAVHSYLNNTLGLPVGDSFWVMSNLNAKHSTALLDGVDRMNLFPSGVQSHPIFWLLLRDFHRGYYDHLHGWHDDGVHQFQQLVQQPVSARVGAVSVELERVSFFDQLHQSASQQPASLRLVFDKKPSSTPVLTLIDDQNVEHRVPTSALHLPNSERSAIDNSYYIEVLISVDGSPNTMAYRGQPKIIRVERITEDCILNRVEWDSFSRSIVKIQTPVLERFNIRPVMSTAHGGYTRAQNLGRDSPHSLTPSGEKKFVDNVNWTLRPQGDRPDSHAYHADFLSQIGVTSIAEIPPVSYPYTVNSRARLEALQTSSFWKVDKTWGLSIMPPTSQREISDHLRAVDPIASAANVTSLLCIDNMLCLRSEQGATLGYNIATSLAHVAAGQTGVAHNWYQHLGTALLLPDQPITFARPFATAVQRHLWRLSNHMYNWTGTIPLSQRTWVASPAVWQTYRISLKNLSNSITVDSSSLVQIQSVYDDVLGRIWPDSADPSRELHGLTVYVPSAAQADLQIDGRKISTFTRNAQDETGRQSITVVNGAYPVHVLGGVSPENVGNVAVMNGSLAFESANGIILKANDKDPMLRFEPFEMAFWNVSHLRLVTKQKGNGRLFVRVVMVDGNSIELKNDTSAPLTGAHLLLGPDSVSTDWIDRTISLTDLRPFRAMVFGESPTLPLGRIKLIEIGLRDATAESELIVRHFGGLQALPHALAPDMSVVVAGRATSSNGDPAKNVEIVLNRINGVARRARTDEYGYYAFFGEKRGKDASIYAILPSKSPCFAKRGSLFPLMRDEVELDIDVSVCN